MAGNRSPWRAVRPVFLAGAAAFTWLTFSASTASADTLPDATTLLGGVTNSVSVVTEKLPVPTPAAPEAAPVTSTPAPVSSPGLLTPLAGAVSGLADQVVSSVPVVNNVVPAGTVSVITVPIAQVADAATAEAVDVVIPPVADALPVLDPVLQPVTGLITGSAPLPVELPELSLVNGDAESTASTGTVPASEGAALPEAGLAADSSTIPSAVAGEAEAGTPASGLTLAQASAPLRASRAGTGSAQEQPAADPAPITQGPAAPASGSGSGAASAGLSSAAAWLSPFNFDFAAPGTVRAGEISEHAPAPVSFDPGSSPD
jgi:hypothetical protein